MKEGGNVERFRIVVMRMSMRRIFRRGFSQISTETNGLVQETSTFRSNRATVIFLGVPVVLTTMLGIWQVKRLQNKRVKIAMRLQRLQGTPLEGLPDDLDEKRDEYKRVRNSSIVAPMQEKQTANTRCRGEEGQASHDFFVFCWESGGLLRSFSH